MHRVPPAMAMAVLGHADASITLEIYTPVAPELAYEAAEAMDRALTASGAGGRKQAGEAVDKAAVRLEAFTAEAIAREGGGIADAVEANAVEGPRLKIVRDQ